MAMTRRILLGWMVSAVACTERSPPPVELAAGVVFTYPVDGQIDVPTGARIVVSFSGPAGDDVESAIRLVGPSGPVDVTTALAAGGKTITLHTAARLEPGATYDVIVDSSSTDPLFRFTTRDDRPRSGPPALIAIDGSDPASPGTFRPLVDTSTLRLVFSEPLDPRSVVVGPGAIELVDVASGEPVACRLFAERIHASIDPIAPLIANRAYELRLGDRLRDTSGETLAPTAVPIVPIDSAGRGTVSQVLRIRRDGDAVAAIARLDVANVIELAHPMIGEATSTMVPGAVASELGDPAALGGPIAFAIGRGQRLVSSGLDIALAGAVPSGLTTGDIEIELLADANGRLYRNRYRPSDVEPDNDASPVYVDLALDLAVFARDPTGNAVLAQSVLGVQMVGVAMADEGTLALEVVGAMDVDLLGVARAPANLVLDLVSDPGAIAATDRQPPQLADVEGRALSPDDGIELLFDEPIDIDRASTGGIAIVDAGGTDVATAIEIAGSAVVVRPREPLPGGTAFDVALRDVADVAGNAMPPQVLALATPPAATTGVPLAVVSADPGTACVRVDPTLDAPGRCRGGQVTDDAYHPFAVALDDAIDIAFDRAAEPASLVLGTACGDGSVRVEHIDADGRCLGAVAGALVPRRRGLSFVPDLAWVTGDRYRILLVSGPDAACHPGEICGRDGIAASFDPLAGAMASGGPDLMIDFYGGAGAGTRLFAETGDEPSDANRAALRITGTSGVITGASFAGPDCVPSTPEIEGCMEMRGGMPAVLGAARTDCALPDGTTAATCIPVTLSAQQLYASSVAMTAAALGIPIATETGTSVMRVREPAGGPPAGFIVDRDGTPTMVVALDLYLDAPDMDLPIGDHDMRSKPLSVLLSGPLTFRRDGRIAIELTNASDVAIAIAITAPLGITGGVDLAIPAGEMKLRLLSRPRRRIR